ncbi:tRNA synthetases class I (R) domain-containing protein [Ditylenchus destructor]|uniref:arginine--tRNA ligase n=1 Tax=Ditylenchus destructor TaxID=166010 RepID=A0AAD4RCF0_9BILA|nr:tRNA synthetases class I (R) domain-containing protein [Ditylenchus destructor]
MPLLPNKDVELANFVQKTNEQAKTLEDLQQLLTDIEAGRCTDNVLKNCPEVAAKLSEKEKLEYRLNIMKRAVSENGPQGSTKSTSSDKTNDNNAKKTKNNDSISDTNSKAKQFTRKEKAGPKIAINYVQVEDYGDSVIENLNHVFGEIVKQLYPELEANVIVKETSQSKFGDYQFDMSPLIANKISTACGAKISPEDVAKDVASKVPSVPLIGKVEVLRAFINIFINNEHICKRISSIFLDGVKSPKVSKKKVIIDFSSPNIAKQMHVGHLRSTIIGESLSRFMEYMGFSVLRLNHIGDWGTQFGMLIAHLQEMFPNYLNETPPIEDLQAFYKESKKRFDEDESFKSRAYQCVVKLQSFDEDIKKAWQQICDVSRKDFESIYKRLDIQVQERGESYYQSMMVKLVEELKIAGFLQEDEGRKVFFPSGCIIPLTLIKSDGGFTYDTSDLATLKNRLFDEEADWILYVVDRGQSEHFETIYAAGRDLGWYDPKIKRVEHVQFGLVLGEDNKKFKTRSGDTVRLTDLLDEGVRRAEAKLIEKGRDKELSETHCIKYADLCHSRTSDYVFSYDKMLEDRGNTAVYLLYAYARIRSIARTSQTTREQIRAYVNLLGNDPLPLTEQQEFRLARQILKFSDCILNILDNLQLHKLCDYVYNLATSFHDFYKDCYVVEKNAKTGESSINYHRLVLCEVTADVMLQCFNILGLHPLEKM